MRKPRFLIYLPVFILILIEVISMSRDSEGANLSGVEQSSKKRRGYLSKEKTYGMNGGVDSALVPILVLVEVFNIFVPGSGLGHILSDYLSLSDDDNLYLNDENENLGLKRNETETSTGSTLLDFIASGICKGVKLLLRIIGFILRVIFNILNPFKFLTRSNNNPELISDGDVGLVADFFHVPATVNKPLKRSSSEDIPKNFLQIFVNLVNSICDHETKRRNSNKITRLLKIVGDKLKRSSSTEIPERFIEMFERLVKSICAHKFEPASSRLSNGNVDRLKSIILGPKLSNIPRSESKASQQFINRLKQLQRVKSGDGANGPVSNSMNSNLNSYRLNKRENDPSSSSIDHYETRNDKPSIIFEFRLSPRLPWHEAKRACESDGGKLARPAGADEYNEMIRQAKLVFIGKIRFWIGFHRPPFQRSRKTSFGEHPLFRGSNVTEICAVMYFSETDYQGYGNAPCRTHNYYMCEFRNVEHLRLL